MITEHKESEAARQLLQGEICQDAKLGVLGLLAGEIAHDFNNLLTAINGHLSIAQGDNRDPKVRESLSQVAQAVGRAKHLTQRILLFDRWRTDDFQPVQLPAIITEVLQFLQPTWPAGVEIATDLPADAEWIVASPHQLHQVITNLFVNAVQAMEAGPGRLAVRVDSIEVGRPFTEPHPDLDHGRYVRLTVSDTGHGMDPATQQRIFEPFFTTKRPGHGTGLGLAVVHRIIKDHGGSIQVSSELGRGTTFRLFFAAQPFPAAAGEAKSPGGLRAAGG